MTSWSRSADGAEEPGPGSPGEARGAGLRESVTGGGGVGNTGAVSDSVAVRRGRVARVAPIVGRAFVGYCVLGLALYRALNSYLTEVSRGGYTYRTSEWLISYAGGFVRRGLFGDLLFGLAPAGAPTIWALAAVQFCCYAVVLAYLLSYLQRARYSWSALTLALGPAALPFIGWDVGGGFRKEILVFVAVILLAWARAAARQAVRVGLQALAVVVFGIAMFSWEASVVGVPIMLYLLRDDAGRPTLRLPRGWPSLAIVSLAAVGGTASVLSRGTPEISGAICNQVIQHGLTPELCHQAIEALSWSTDYVLQEQAARFPLYWGYLILLPLALLPIAVSPWLRRHWPWFVATVIAVAPLYVIGQDYGRWAHLLVMLPALAIMAEPPAAAEWPRWRGGWAFAYLTLWALPHWLRADDAWPWLGFFVGILNLLGFQTGGSYY